MRRPRRARRRFGQRAATRHSSTTGTRGTGPLKSALARRPRPRTARQITSPAPVTANCTTTDRCPRARAS
jgi:hypothetical protein